MQKLLERGEALFADGKITEAESCFRTVLNSNPNSLVYNNLGVLAYQQGRSNEAAEHFINAIRIDSTNLDAVFNLCEVLKASGAIHEAAPILQPLTEKYPEISELRELLDEAVESDKEGKSGESAGSTNTSTLRVLHGTCEVANQMFTISRGLRDLGIVAETLSYYPTYLKYRTDHVLDVNSFSNQKEAVEETRKYAADLVDKYDIFHFHFGSSLALDYSDLPMLVEAKKKVVMQYWGSEVRKLSRARQLNPWVKTKVVDENLIHQGLKAVSTHVNHCIVSDYELYEYVCDYFEHVHVIPAALDLSQYEGSEEEPGTKERLLVVHAPTSPEYKGTPQLVEAVGVLQKEIDFDFELVQGKSHDAAKAVYARADVIVDQLLTGSYGLFSIEAMAMGKPVITWISNFMKAKYPSELPIVAANPDTIAEDLRNLLGTRDSLKELGRRGCRYVKQYHDHNAIADKILNVYRQMIDEA